jgi:hypothetical protein
MLFSLSAPAEDRVETTCDKCTVFRQDGAHLAHDIFLEGRSRDRVAA